MHLCKGFFIFKDESNPITCFIIGKKTIYVLTDFFLRGPDENYKSCKDRSKATIKCLSCRLGKDLRGIKTAHPYAAANLRISCEKTGKSLRGIG